MSRILLMHIILLLITIAYKLYDLVKKYLLNIRDYFMTLEDISSLCDHIDPILTLFRIS